MINKKNKDRLFCFIYGREENKNWTLSLYNAVNDSDFKNANDISIETIENFLYMGMKNDVAFLIHDTLNFYEHQSTYNPNMPLRDLIYLVKSYTKYVEKNNYNIYGCKVIPLPVPKFVVFYNGNMEEEDKILRLSDAFPENIKNESDIEITVRFYNINAGHNAKLMDKCRTLREYSEFIDSIRKKSKLISIDNAVSQAIDEMPNDSEIKPFLLNNRAEVLDMLFEEYDEAKVMALFKEEGRKEGKEEGKEEGKKEGDEERLDKSIRAVSDALNKGLINNEQAELLIKNIKEA